MISISRAGSIRSPVIVVGRFALKFAQTARGRASVLRAGEGKPAKKAIKRKG
jgi:hypothetical protein